MQRQGFTKIAKDVGCQLYFPYPGEQVVLLQTGLLMHLQVYLQVCTLAKCLRPACGAMHLRGLVQADDLSCRSSI